MQKDDYQAEIFSNRLQKKARYLRKWVCNNKIGCFRLYDCDIPEVPLLIDVYDFLPDFKRYATVYLYSRPYEKDESEEIAWLSKMQEVIKNVLQIPLSNIITKERKVQKGLNQYNKNENDKNSIFGIVYENDLRFKINLSTYLDTGLFLDNRELRKIVRDVAENKSVLNLFCYTSSFSVYAASGKAKKIESVDLSNTYLAWSKENMKLNGFDDEKYIYTKSDCVSFLEKKQNGNQKFDIIILDPPTFSNSKSTKTVLDINKDYAKLISLCVNILSKKGLLFFSTNSNHIHFDENLVEKTAKMPLKIQEITNQTISKDFENKKCHRAWKITKKLEGIKI